MDADQKKSAFICVNRRLPAITRLAALPSRISRRYNYPPSQAQEANMSAMPLSPNDAEVIIRKTGAEWAKNWNAKDLNKLVEAYAADAVYMPPHHAAVNGHDAIRDYLKGPLAHGASELSFEVTYIRQSGDLAYDVGRYSMMCTQKDGSRKKDQGKYLTVWKRQPGGEWKIAADSWSSDVPA